jgi:hypothetical protein
LLVQRARGNVQQQKVYGQYLNRAIPDVVGEEVELQHGPSWEDGLTYLTLLAPSQDLGALTTVKPLVVMQ